MTGKKKKTKARNAGDIKTKARKPTAKKGVDYSRFMIYVTIAAMLFSALYMIEWTPPKGGKKGDLPSMDAYNVKEMLGGGNSSIKITVREITGELVAKIKNPLSFETIRNIQNTSIEGLQGITLEVGNPIFDDSIVGAKTYMLFRFKFDEIKDNRTESIENILDTELGDNRYDLLRGCIGNLPTNISGPGSDLVYFPCEFNTKIGDYFRIFLLKKTRDDVFEGTIGFVEKKIAVGPIVQGEVVNITSIIAQGIIISDLNKDMLNRINPINIQITPPAITANETLGDNISGGIKSLQGVEILAGDNKTFIYFNSSHRNITEILDRENINYTLEPGNLAFTVPENTNISLIDYTLNEGGIKNITLEKAGVLSLPGEIVIDDTLATIQNNNRFDAILKIDTGIGERINVSLNTIKYGNQIFIIGAEEI